MGPVAPGAPDQIPDTPDGQPGLITPVNSDEWDYFGGTSAAAPHAAGVVALVRGTHPAASTTYGTGVLRERRSGRGFYGFGLVDALAAVR